MIRRPKSGYVPCWGSMKHLLRTSDLTTSDIERLLDLSTTYKSQPMLHHGLLQGETVVLYFDKPSTRTRISMETAVCRLGGHPVTVRPTELQLGKGEPIADTAKVVSAYARAFAIRTFRDADVQQFAEASTIPIINMLTDGHHPTQSIADLLTLRDHFGSLRGLRLAYSGDGNNNVTHSLMEAAALMGIDMTVAAPPSYEPHPWVTAWTQEQAARSGCRFKLTHDPKEAVQGADAVYTDLWVSMGNSDHERPARSAVLSPYRVDEALMALAAPAAVFLHCLPANRREEVAAEVIDGPQSLVFAQAANRLPTGQAILYAAITGELQGCDPAFAARW